MSPAGEPGTFGNKPRFAGLQASSLYGRRTREGSSLADIDTVPALTALVKRTLLCCPMNDGVADAMIAAGP